MLDVKPAADIGLQLEPRLTDYRDYRKFLADYYAFQKSRRRGFSYRRFAALAGLKSSNYLMLVINGQRNLSTESAPSVARAMKLSGLERDLFTSLVRASTASTLVEQESSEKERRIAIKKLIAKELPQEKAEYLSNWYFSLVRELPFLPNFQCTPEWIAKKLGGQITVEQATRAISVLLHLGLWRRRPDSKIEVCDTFLDTGPEDRLYAEASTARLHKQNMLAWARRLESLPKEERELGLLQIPINDQKLPELKARIQKFQDEIVGWLQSETEPTRIVQLGTYLVPMTVAEPLSKAENGEPSKPKENRRKS